LGDILKTNWRQSERFRFVPDSNLVVSRSQVHTLVSNLNLLKTGGDLRGWIIIIEEAHRFAGDSETRSFVAEARKFCKVVIVTSDYQRFRGLGEAVMPSPREAV